jgi:hypothetical protein
MTTSVSTRSPGTLNPTRQQLDELDALLQRMLELPVHKPDDTEQDVAEEPADEPPPPAQPTPPPPPDPLPLASGGRGIAVKVTRPATPVSYMVVETASPRPLPPASGFEPRPSNLTPRLVPVKPPQAETVETPVPPQQKTDETPAPVGETPLLPGEEEMWVPLRSTWRPSAQTWPPLADSWHQANGGLPAIPEVMPTPIPSPRLDLSPPPLEAAASRGESEVRLGSPDLPPAMMDTPSVAPAPVSAPPAAEPRLSLSAEDAPVSVSPLLLPLLWFNQGFDACLEPLGPLGRWLCGPRGRQLFGILGLTCLAAAVAVAISAGMGWTW